jgi:membrane-associated protease RseP (regulator of RpoE activity)
VPAYAPERLIPPEPGPSPWQWALSLILLCLTFVTATVAGMFYATGYYGAFDVLRLMLRRPQVLLSALSFSFSLLVILAAHEMGHFLACRHYGMRATPPYFLPVPLPLTGTLGAFIKIKSAFRSRRALFDIGIAGPLAGFIFALPVLWTGIGISKVVPKLPAHVPSLSFGEPLLFRLVAAVTLGYAPGRQDLMAHPMAMAGWVGLLATSLNLLPIWQLDGGHIAYAMCGAKWQKRLSITALVALILVSFLGWPTPSYLLFGVMLLLIGWRAGFHHPAPLVDDQPLGAWRVILGCVAFAILVLSFTPVPIVA